MLATPKAITVEVVRWFKYGDHILVSRYAMRYNEVCSRCGGTLNSDTHGWIKTPQGALRVCPGDYLITDCFGVVTPMKPHIFSELYDLKGL